MLKINIDLIFKIYYLINNKTQFALNILIIFSMRVGFFFQFFIARIYRKCTVKKIRCMYYNIQYCMSYMTICHLFSRVLRIYSAIYYCTYRYNMFVEFTLFIKIIERYERRTYCVSITLYCYNIIISYIIYYYVPAVVQFS